MKKMTLFLTLMLTINILYGQQHTSQQFIYESLQKQGITIHHLSPDILADHPLIDYRTETKVLDSLVSSIYIQSDWVNSRKELFNYDNEGREIVQTIMVYSFLLDIWRVESIKNTSYDTYNNPVEIILQKWNFQTSQIENQERIQRTFFENIPLETIIQHWDQSTQSWVNNTRIIFVADEFITLTEETELWDIATNSWQPHLLAEFTYNNNFLAQILIKQWLSNSLIYENFSRIDFEWDANGNIQYMLNLFWNQSAHWEREFDLVSTYNSNNQLEEEITSFYLNGNFSFREKLNPAYDNGILICNTYFIWHLIDNDWNFSHAEEFAHDDDGDIIQMIDYLWNAQVWLPHFKNNFHFGALQVVAATEANASSFTCLLANPYSKGSSIMCQTNSSIQYTANIYSLSGQSLIELKQQTEQAWEFPVSLDGGIYLLKITNKQGKNIYQQKVVIH